MKSLVLELVQFLSIVLLLEFTPGPAVLFVMFQSAKYDLKHAFAGIFGLVTANIIWISLAASGLGLFLQQSPTLYGLIKNLGVLYLLYLGGKILFKGVSLPKGENIHASRSYARVYYQGVLTSLTNPKALLFFMALLPLFAREEHFISDIAFWGAIKITCLISVMGVYAVTGNTIFRVIKHSPLADGISRLFGLGIIGAAVGIAQQ